MGVTTTILGASGYAGQETLDRVLAHPQLKLVALGSDLVPFTVSDFGVTMMSPTAVSLNE